MGTFFQTWSKSMVNLKGIAPKKGLPWKIVHEVWVGVIYWNYPPRRMPVTTRIIPFFLRNPYKLKPSFSTVNYWVEGRPKSYDVEGCGRWWDEFISFFLHVFGKWSATNRDSIGWFLLIVSVIGCPLIWQSKAKPKHVGETFRRGIEICEMPVLLHCIVLLKAYINLNQVGG